MKARQVNLTERGLVLIEELLVHEGIMDEGESRLCSHGVLC